MRVATTSVISVYLLIFAGELTGGCRRLSHSECRGSCSRWLFAVGGRLTPHYDPWPSYIYICSIRHAMFVCIPRHRRRLPAYVTQQSRNSPPLTRQFGPIPLRPCSQSPTHLLARCPAALCGVVGWCTPRTTGVSVTPIFGFPHIRHYAGGPSANIQTNKNIFSYILYFFGVKVRVSRIQEGPCAGNACKQQCRLQRTSHVATGVTCLPRVIAASFNNSVGFLWQCNKRY